MSELKHDKWAGTTYGNGFMHRWLIRMLRFINVRVLYAFTFVFVIPVTIIVNSKARRVIYRFYRRRFGMSPLKAAWMTYRNFCAFSQVVIDRFAMYAGKRFKISIDGYDQFEALSKSDGGFVQLSSHIGNYELAGYSLVAEDKRFNALVFGGEKASVMANRNKLFDGNNIRMIAVEADMSHLFAIDSAIADGEIVSMPADRVFGSQKSFDIDFLGAQARFPQGPFILAATRDVPMLYVSVMKRSATKYHITVRRIDTAVTGNSRKKAADLARQYVALLEGTVKQHPTQWYNYFDFWVNDATN